MNITANDRSKAKREYLIKSFGHYRELFSTKDFLGFSSIYDALLDAVRKMNNVDDVIIWVAFSDHYDKYCKTLNDIILSYEREIFEISR